MHQFSLNTPAEGFIDLTGQVRKIVASGNVQNGLCQIFVPHTTAGVTINALADPYILRVGQRLRLPASARPLTPEGTCRCCCRGRPQYWACRCWRSPLPGCPGTS